MAADQLSARVFEDVDGVILAGGQSQRMGVDKALLDLGGSPMVAQVAKSLGQLASVTIVGGSFDESVVPDARYCPDEHPGSGPLGGMISGFHATAAPVVVSVACDLPRLSAHLLSQLIRARSVDDADVCVPLVAGRFQWHLAAWHRRSLRALERRFATGERSIFRAARGLSLTALVPTRPEELADIDTPADVARHRPG